MNLMQIYDNLLQNHNNEYYTELAKSEILVIPVFIEIMKSGSYGERIKAKGVLEKLCENQASDLAPFSKYIVNAINAHNDLPSWCLWKIVVKILELDPAVWTVAENSFLSALSADDIGQFSIVCDCAVKIAELCPNSKTSITDILTEAITRTFRVNGEISEICGKIACEKANASLDVIGGNGC